MAVLAGYIEPIQSWVACPDQDVAYGAKPASGMKVCAATIRAAKTWPAVTPT
jgi:hypothetical protein